MRRPLLHHALSAALAVGACLVSPPAAAAETYAPPPGKVWHALTGSNPTSSYQSRVGKHVAVRGSFIRWGSSYEWAINEAASNDSRLLLHVSTAVGQHQPEAISPGAIARGEGDR
jgi:hypothetical protein